MCSYDMTLAIFPKLISLLVLNTVLKTCWRQRTKDLKNQ